LVSQLLNWRRGEDAVIEAQVMSPGPGGALAWKVAMYGILPYTGFMECYAHDYQQH
jgi:hypothetical protein